MKDMNYGVASLFQSRKNEKLISLLVDLLKKVDTSNMSELNEAKTPNGVPAPGGVPFIFEVPWMDKLPEIFLASRIFHKGAPLPTPAIDIPPDAETYLDGIIKRASNIEV